jgi:hypothetical protein
VATTPGFVDIYAQGITLTLMRRLIRRVAYALNVCYCIHCSVVLLYHTKRSACGN